MTDWSTQLRAYRRVNGLTQMELAEVLAVTQATISRWESGRQMPELAVQTRLRDMLFRGRTAGDARLGHFVRTSFSPLVLISESGRFLAISESAAAPGGRTPEQIVGSSIEANLTEDTRACWTLARKEGFFRGEVASIQSYCDLVTFRGDHLFAQMQWHFYPLGDGRPALLLALRYLEETEYERLRHPPRILPFDVLIER